MTVTLRRTLNRSAIIFALGFFALVAQTVLFREFLTVFEGNELGVGCFFGSWLVWVALGALVARVATPTSAKCDVRSATRFPYLALVYVPAFVAQHALIGNARALAGVETYEIFPFAAMSALAFLVNAPLSFVTGFLFTLACRWFMEDETGTVGRVYILETLGGCVGGVVVTVLLACGVAGETTFVWAALVLSLGVLAAAHHRVLRFLPVAVCLVALAAGLGGRWSERHSRAQWTRLLPAESYRGRFTTAQARYLYGVHQGQFAVMSGGGVCETLPAGPEAAEVAALHLAQKPNARTILVIGSGSLGICAKFAQVPQVNRVTWLHPDPAYPSALEDVLPAEMRVVTAKIDIPGMDVREFLRDSPRSYDLAVVNLPDVTTLVLNRYCTREFLVLLKGALTEAGVASVRISGAENYIGSELAYLGASMLTTLESVFANTVLKPGDETWLIASDGEDPSCFARGLFHRFRAIEGAADLYPPQALLSLFPPDRIQFQMNAYQRVAEDAEEALLLNTDRRPLALLYSLLLVLRRVGWKSFIADLPGALRVGVWICACPIAVYGLLRLVYLLKGRQEGTRARAYDGAFLVFATGLAGMALSIVLMFLYQSSFGSLFLYIGLITALYMLGAFLGSILTERLVARRETEPAYLLPAVIAAHLLLVLLIAGLPGAPPRLCFAGLFLVCGACSGAYFPMAARRMALAGRDAAWAGATLETVDHGGGALGAALTGLVLLPLFGANPTLALLALLIAVNLVPQLLRRERRRTGDWFERVTGPAGYTLVGVAACLLIASQLVAWAQTGQIAGRVADAAKALTAGAELEPHDARAPDGSTFTYYETGPAAEHDGGFVFSTAELARRVAGYGGPIILAAYVGHDGELRDFRVIHSNETPVYLDRVFAWQQTLKGKNLFGPDPFAGVDAVTGATMTCEAILDTLETAGHAFAKAALAKELAAAPPTPTRRLPDRDFLCLTAFMALAVVLRYRPNVWIRRLMLLATLGVTGFLLNLQYSAHQVMALLTGDVFDLGLNGPFFLALVVPALVVLFGNVYCGYVCPFGALQELLGDLRPKHYETDPAKTVWRYGRAVKYLLLLLLVALFAMTRDYGALAADPLITVFSALRERAALWMGAAVLALGLVFRRFWCRNLCPAGAFLSLLNGLRLLRKWPPFTRPARCDLGVRTGLELDCIYCDRCRHENE